MTKVNIEQNFFFVAVATTGGSFQRFLSGTPPMFGDPDPHNRHVSRVLCAPRESEGGSDLPTRGTIGFFEQLMVDSLDPRACGIGVPPKLEVDTTGTDEKV